MSLVRLLLLVIVSGLVAACGYQLRGLQNENIELAIASVTIRGGERDDALLRLLRRGLQQAGVSEVANDDTPDVLLQLDSVSQSRRVLSVDTTAKVSEHELYYAVAYSLTPAAGQTESRTASARRDITFNEEQVLAKAEEEQRLYDEMRRDVVNTILRALQRVQLAP